MILPVIHYADDNQAMRNAERAFEAGCDGVMLIEMRGRNNGLLFAGSAIKRHWPSLHVGINHLGSEAEAAVHASLGAGADSTWTDEQLTHSGGETELEAARLARVLGTVRSHTVFCAVAFKYQRPEPDPAVAAVRAVELGFIPTTSGPGTGEAADPGAVAAMRAAIGSDAPLAVASGITPENAAAFLPSVTHVLVSTGVSSSFHEFDPARLRALVEIRNGLRA
jgi:predicted TIM-barrel enzyme